jgi:hypothetical protein
MNYRTNSLILLALLFLAGAPHVARAAESYDNCTGFIATVPAVISTPGTWCLNKNLATSITSGNAILISANNVTLDCNDFNLDGLAAGTGTAARGVSASSRLNATIRHCNIRGFEYGVFLIGATGAGHAVEDSRFDSNTDVGVWVEGDGSVVQRNQIADTGGSTLAPATQGIYTRYSVDVLDNSVAGVVGAGTGVGSATGIYTSLNASGSISGNRVRGVLKGGTGTTRGIYNSSAGRITMDGNDVVGDASVGSVGLYCVDATARARNNVLGAFATAIKNCGDAGGNDITP